MDYEKLIPVISITLLYGARLKEISTRRDIIKGQVHEKTTLRMFMVSGLILTFGGCTEYWWWGSGVNYWTLAAGWIISLAAFAIRRQAIAALGKFWSLHVEIRAEHQFVQSGPFRWVRHPAYFSMILELLGGGLVLQSWWSLALAYVWFFPVLSRRVRLEEEALIAKFGPAYEEYRAKVPAFLPWKGRCL